MVNSMTGFAAVKGAFGGKTWAWEMRGVNARGLDLRLRLPEGAEALEPVLRKALAARLSRGNVTLNLRLQNDPAGVALSLDEAQLDTILAAMKAVEARSDAYDLHLTASTAAEILSLRGVLDGGRANAALPDDLLAALKADIPALIDSFIAARAAEGAALSALLKARIIRIDALIDAARDALGDRQARVRATIVTNLQRVMDNSDGVDPARLAQELALIAVKADVAEELDRLSAHVAAARDLLTANGPIGRKFDFLTQEFNREANTLCSKSNDAALTRIGLDLKTVIDQMREQVQNVE